MEKECFPCNKRKPVYYLMLIGYMLCFVKLHAVVNMPNSQDMITGTVISASDGAPLPGVNILVKGTAQGVVTDFDGNYEIEGVAPDAELEFSYIGFKTQTVAVDGRSTVDVSLVEDLEQLDEVVVVGYGTQSRQKVTGAVSSVKSEDIVTQGSNTVEKALQGRVPGVQVESAGGDPGSGVRILIRGTGSLGNNNPLYIVDGVQVSDINNLNPMDIASMDILKDASAAAIYGSRAANGVVIITTKTGRKDENTIDFSTYYGFQTITDKLDVLNAAEWAGVSNAAHDNAGLGRLDIASDPGSLGKGTNWQNEIYRTAPVKNYNLSASGGGEHYTYSVSGGYMEQDGIVKNTGYDRWNLRFKSTLTKGRFKIGETVILSKENWRNMADGWGGQGGNPVGSAPKMIPVFDVYNPDAVGGYGGAYGPVLNVANPVAQLNLEDLEEHSKEAIVNAFAEVSILDGLKYKLNLGYTSTSGYDYTYTYPYEVGTLFTNLDSDLYEARYETEYTLAENTLTYDKTFGKHSINALVGYTFQNTKYRILTGAKSGMPPGVNVLDAGTTNIASGSNAWENSLVSYLGRLTYSFDDRYVLTGILRRDGSSRFGKDQRFGNFPSLAFAWNLSNEPFFAGLQETIDIAKLRLSYGVLGNQEFDDYRFSPAINLNTNYVVGREQLLWPGAIQTAFATPDIKWESSKTFNVGTDLSFLDRRLEFVFDYFVKKNSDVLLQVPIPLSTGASGNSPYINAGQIINKGFEASLNFSNSGEEFSYQLTGTIASVDNEVDFLGTGSQQIFGGQPTHHGASATVTQAGLPVGAFYLIKTDGIFNSAEEVNAHTHEGALIQPNARPGDIRFVDHNNDGQIDEDDRQYLGSPNPDFSYGLGAAFNWKNFDMNLFFQGTQGNKIYNGLRQDLEGMNLEINYLKSTLNAWTPENQNTGMPRAVINDPNLNSRTSDRFLEDGSYFRFKTFQLGYTLPENVLKLAKVKRCRIYISLDNIFTITDYKGYNPDLGRSGSVLDRGVDFGHVAYPLSRTFLTGVELSF
ncbi:SusC/RagA family TonB-linked outer membrane protein [Sinomicrobium soli]|uniref:SusC/RagA family TonB-linked outer membrane protein n=1 Tax=Sinomicrobium sp. N-1-3-6 TaxID=2219864 RepID=UPI000DCC2F46|nr:TonB-dependent receptor [Sinomicrobium sp. N-1-3-6]RAV28439.1 SusC/RagA family TonB-linked outer membrane protein [Sinomicrobium sp. N-1-3-6]